MPVEAERGKPERVERRLLLPARRVGELEPSRGAVGWGGGSEGGAAAEPEAKKLLLLVLAEREGRREPVPETEPSALSSASRLGILGGEKAAVG